MDNQNHHCVPTWNNNLDDVGNPIAPLRPQPLSPSSTLRVTPSQSLSASLSGGPDTSMLDYEMAELTWENGQLTMHGLGLPRVPSKSNLADVTRASGMLESVVNQACCTPKNNINKQTPLPPRVGVGTCEQHPDDDDVVPWYSPTAPASVSVSLDALVPNNTTTNNNNVMGCSTRVGSCSAAVTRVPMGSDWSVSVSASGSRRKKRQAEDTCEQLRSVNTITNKNNIKYNTNNNNGVTSTSFGASPENTKTFTLDDHDSASLSRSQRERGDEEENQKHVTAKSTGSTKRSRAAAVHNQSERKRRDKINQRMKTLQKLVPNSNKTDKASMLDEAIEYLKNLQAQIQMLSRMSLPSMSMMMPLAIQHQLQLSSMMAPIGLGMGMGMDHMNMGSNHMAGRPNAAPSHLMNMAAAYNMPFPTSDNGSSAANAGAYNMAQGALVSADPLSTYLASQSHPMTMDAYSKMAAIYQQQQQQQQRQYNHHQQPGGPNSNF